MVQKYTCSNGLRIVTEEIETVRSVAIGIWIKAGSRNENHQNNGVSHFLEHMFFKGTEKRNAREIAEAFDSIGGQVNAFTSKEYTCYYAKVLDNHASYALDILADMFFNSSFAEDEMQKEKNVVYEEIKMYDDAPDDIVHDMLSEAVYEKHPLGYPILGTEETLKTFNSESLRKYMKEMYTPENIVISIAGNMTQDFIREVEDLFGHFQGDQSQSTITQPVFHANHLARKKETEQAHLCLGYNGLPVGHKDVYSLIVMNNILGGSMSSRLFQEVREEKALAYSVYSYHSSYQDSGMVTIYGGTGASQLDELYSTIDQTLKSFKQDGITHKELHNSKEQLKGSLMLSLESTNSRMSRNGKNELLLGQHRTLDQIIEEIDLVSIESVHQLATSIFHEPFSMSVISPEGRQPSGVLK